MPESVPERTPPDDTTEGDAIQKQGAREHPREDGIAMNNVETLKAAPRATVIEQAAPFGSVTVWSLHHYQHGKPVGKSLARGDELGEWLSDLRAEGRALGAGWELRGEPVPDAWPGWSVDGDAADER